MKSIVMFLLICIPLSAQVEVFGLRTYANDDEYRPPIIARNEQVTIEFDVTTSLPPNLQIIFRHASKDWKVDNNLLINDPPKTRSETLFYINAPNGAYHYTYRYKNSFPNDRNFVEFIYSGNYRYSIVDHNANDQVLAEGKFIVAESQIAATMRVENRYHPDFSSPLNQMNYISVYVSIPPEYNAADENSIYHSNVTVVDIVKNWNLEQPMRIDLDDKSPETFIEDFMKPNKTFWKRDVPVGNEYRRLDLSSASLYPNNALAVLRGQPDVSRYQWQSKPDANGASKLKAFTGSNSDYLEVEMRLRLPSVPSKKIFAVGGFSEWKVLPEYEMKDDSSTGLFKLRHWVRRGVYDYQYVLGDLDGEGNVINQDWITLEGNDWRTINRYTALVYYHDQRLGGYDRVIGYVRGRNPGSNENKKWWDGTNPQPVNQPRPSTEIQGKVRR